LCVAGGAAKNDIFSRLRVVRPVAPYGLSLTPYRVIPHCRYDAIDEGRDPYLQQLRQGTKAPALLELRIGAQVL
jgi:hypothetical protein